MIIFLNIFSVFLVIYSLFGLVILQPVLDGNMGYYSVIHFICLLALLGVGVGTFLIVNLTMKEIK
tara:strand:- start:109 stop:303 length:195 start_codon:yes stop_codon:yes gene_type:complete